jgi:hypothetical protein
MYSFFYGIDTDKINVTKIVYSKCFISSDILFVTENRESLFMDHLIGQEKYLYIQFGNVMNKYPKSNIYVNVKEKHIYFGPKIELSYQTKYTAVIIEPRCHKALHFVVKNMCENLSNEWTILLIIGNNNVKYVHKCLQHLPIHRIRLHQLNISNLSISEYNQLLVTPYLYSLIPTETFLLFQTDSMILKENKDNVNLFLNYDYVGAPWSDGVGNGGFSLRKKSKMLEIINQVLYNNEPEDVYFSNQTVVSICKPSIEEAKSFSVETLFHPRPFGVHKVWIHPPGNNIVKLYPIVHELIKLNH